MPNSSSEFIDSVLRLNPRVAAFDCDGTLWSGDAGETFFNWEIAKGLVSTEVAAAVRDRHAAYKAGKVSEETMCGEMVSMHKGLANSLLVEAATEFMANSFPGKVFPEMLDLVHRLIANGCELWAVSSSSEWLIHAGMKQFGITPDHVLAGAVAIENGTITERIIRLPSGPGKERALREVAKKNIDAAFGNSRWDTEMLAMAKHAFAINPNPDLEETARKKNWTIYFPEGTHSRA